MTFIQNQRLFAFGFVCMMIAACGNVPPNADGGGMDATAPPCPSDRQWCYRECVNIYDDSNNCGGCGRVCPSGQTCVRGACTLICPAGEYPCGPICSSRRSDNANCGACGRMCPAGSACMNGDCITTCRVGLTGCNGGCQDLMNDRHHCGSCMRDCGETLLCSAGMCVCLPGQTSCAGTCRDLMVDGRNCGACGRVCSSGQVCSAGTCAVSCGMGLTNCEGTCRNLASDNLACGACGRVCTGDRTCREGVCVLACPARSTECSGVCRNVYEDPMNCGACGRVCSFPHATRIRCNNQAFPAPPLWCFFDDCETGWGNCDGNRVNGCETSLATAMNCGACGSTCGANMSCNVDGACVCNSGYGNCDSNVANGCEANLNGDALNCGICGHTCVLANAGAICADGHCAVTACVSGWGDCDHNPDNGCEADLNTNDANCGACGNVCSLAAHATSVGCNGGGCAVVGCEGQWANCDGSHVNGCEANLQTDARNCGSCGATCVANAGCSGGTCVCNAGRADCDGNTTNGCETNIDSDSGNCGACGIMCGIFSRCSGGACGCFVDGWADCDGNRTNGCETYLPNSIANCGVCGNVCPAPVRRTAQCDRGVCSTICASGYYSCGSDCISNDTCCTNSSCWGGRYCPSPGSTCVCSGGHHFCDVSGQCPAIGTACLPNTYAFAACTSWGWRGGYDSPCGNNVVVARSNRVSSATLLPCISSIAYRAGATLQIQFDYTSYAGSCWSAPHLDVIVRGAPQASFSFGPSGVLSSCRAGGSSSIVFTLPSGETNFELYIASGDWCASARITSITVL